MFMFAKNKESGLNNSETNLTAYSALNVYTYMRSSQSFRKLNLLFVHLNHH